MPFYLPIRFAQSHVRYSDHFEWHPFDDANDPGETDSSRQTYNSIGAYVQS